MSDTNTTPGAGSNSFKRLGIIAAVVLVLAGAQYKFNIIPTSASQKAVVPVGVELNQADGPVAVTTPTTSAPLVAACSGGLAHVGGPVVRANIWA
jgi:hypothetical protein